MKKEPASEPEAKHEDNNTYGYDGVASDIDTNVQEVHKTLFRQEKYETSETAKDAQCRERNSKKGGTPLIPNGPYMDIHSHILPGIDDGSQTMDETVRMLRQAYEEGVRVMIATPHFGIRNPSLKKEHAQEVFELTKQTAEENVPGLKLLLGCELFYSDGTAGALERGEAPSLGGTSYAMVEFSTSDSRERIYRCIREVTWNGFIPVIAHLERYSCLEGDIDAVSDLVAQGALVQINCRSFMSEPASGKSRHGLFGKKKQDGFFLERKGDWARQLLSEGLVHFIASDCHDDSFRTPVYRTVLEAMEGCCSDEMLKKIARDNPISLLKNERII